MCEVVSTCPDPLPVPPEEFPPPWKAGGPPKKSSYGKFDWFACAKYLVGKWEAGSKTFTSGESFYCNTTTNKWIRKVDSLEMPPFLSCVVQGAGQQNYCSIFMQQSESVKGALALYSGNEQFCPSGVSVIFANGTGIKNITCSENQLFIESDDGKEEAFVKKTAPTLKCGIPNKPPPAHTEQGGDDNHEVPSACPIPPEVPIDQYPSPWIKVGDFVKSNDGTYDYIYCPDGYIGQLGYGSKAFSFGHAYKCDEATKKWVHHSDNYAAPEFLSCGAVPEGLQNIVHCGVRDRQPNGVVGFIALYPGNEQYCKLGETLQYANGTAIRSLKCSAWGLAIEADDGIRYNTLHPTLECAKINTTKD
ncbi:hypothetical protein PRIPAC_87174 [Pristionchus pacificus]|uniref:Uncharacterized protein n=1 Tax=Pristionchus pacificus TaxID=54126 RepID=A0A2A6B947_PRIPA|nr:hypothetical protein PRIPAC_87174 [Pristionchus pacificus]|eukprot:PDM62391.1 hypothetical protein PRIPAC_51833 [Pristionchus pacificus]